MGCCHRGLAGLHLQTWLGLTVWLCQEAGVDGAPGQQGIGEGGERPQEEWGPWEGKERGGRQKPGAWRPGAFSNVLGIFVSRSPQGIPQAGWVKRTFCLEA